MSVLAVGITGLLIVVATFLLAIFSAHIPGLRHLTGAGLLQPASRPVPYTAVTETDSSALRGDFDPQAGLDRLRAEVAQARTAPARPIPAQRKELS